ncbi:uncharacterized protein MYCFIDRAFT_193188 [Pseudocercospora fijiensis CIRAD86]|uniref:DUF7905 domain-containing protein n=1 Tax=Pseudocercospora fijiensis (strain CIRAD86) TaxID=383855 RepID=N1QCQ0_PSEFD|nr:uncharacterized protein MYCFIDRAFT_193188 [Pseudocercospora fijiensis CIRAD86]EME89218.1 hypothetical protein MYCFIDRAFT_193188 [Pseudocercospora fijiensis CIRAD86]
MPSQHLQLPAQVALHMAAMEDYELANARTWDDSIAPPPDTPEPAVDSGPEWELVGNTKQSKKKQNQNRRHQQQKVAARPSAFQQPPLRRPQPEKENQRPRPAFRVTGQHSASKWRRARGLDGEHTKTPESKQPAPRLVAEADNNAQSLWRHHRPALDHIRVPPVLAIEDDSRHLLETVAKDLGTFIHCPVMDKHAAHLTFGIWGEDADVAATKNALLFRIDELMSQKGRSAGSFAKVVSLTPVLRQRYEDRWAREIEKSRFRQFPPQGMAFPAIASFHWPSREYKPEEVLGLNIEAFDAIRMDTSCYIVYVPELSVFQVMGKERKVKQALLRLRKSCFQLTARSVNPARTYLVRWLDGAEIPTHVYLEPYPPPAVLTSSDAVDDTPSMSPRGEGFEESMHKIGLNRHLSKMNTERVRVTLGNALRKIHFYQGHITLRVRLGTFLLSSFRMPEDAVNENPQDVLYELKEYEDMTKESQFFGRVTEEIGDATAEAKVHDMLLQASDLLTPHGAMTTVLRDVKPVFAAIFVFDDIHGALQLYMTWHELEEKQADGPEYLLEQTKWTRLDRDTNRPTPLLDMSLTDLHTGSAWQFEIAASRSVEEYKVPQNLRDFAKRVTIDPVQAVKQMADKSFIRYNPFMRLYSFRQEVIFRYNILNSDYTLELKRFQDRIFSTQQMLIEKPKVTVYEPRWGLNVFRTDWDTAFSKNERLPIGEVADWDDTFEVVFPSDIGPDVEDNGDGFEQLLGKLDKIAALVRESHASGEDAEEIE